MRLRISALVVAIGCVLAVHLSANAAPAPPRIITISDHTPYPGQGVDFWFKLFAPNDRMKIFIDTPANVVGTVMSSSTGYGHLRFTLSKYANVGSRHHLGVYDPATDEAAYGIITIVPRP